MCSIPIALAVFSTVTSFVGDKQDAGAAEQSAAIARRTGENNRIIAENNADLQEQQAADARARGAVDEATVRRQILIQRGQQEAIFAANGIDFGEGTAANILEDTTRIGEIDAQTVRTNAENDARFFEGQARNTRQSGVNAVFQSEGEAQGLENVAKRSNTQAFGSIIRGGTKVADKWYQ